MAVQVRQTRRKIAPVSYVLLRPALFALEPELAHHVTLASLKALERVGLAPVPRPREGCERQVMGITFPNPVGLGAGLDKNGAYIDALATLGFGFIEVGTVTPRPQPGNPRPRLFRVPEAHAIVNRMGFNNHGLERFVENVHRARWRGVLGINIGKNFDTPMEYAARDYLACLKKVYALASYVTVNISSPNTKGLRDLQAADQLDALLAALARERDELARRYRRRVPLALKIAPDLEQEQVDAVAALLRRYEIDAVIATNTTIARDGVAALPNGNETGGLSGAPLTVKSTAIIERLAGALAGAIPVIGVGGIMNGADARAKIAAGASLVQLYTGLIYRGPALVAECLDVLCGAARHPAARLGR
ncbi:MAG TPA: quinone-dependent dihydroorotate dehydrogenase [Burkholderiales bacterium]|nr:quinone-dependent dihydroorotate dehydrogenase [Burkholderiales bacterium]